MAADTVVSHELKSLQDELSASQREQPSPPADPISVTGGSAAQASQLEGAAEEQQLHGTVSRFVEAITEFVEEAENVPRQHR